ncbi:MAG: DUF1330 domain-containing protein [Pseudomonadales bacterium]
MSIGDKITIALLALLSVLAGTAAVVGYFHFSVEAQEQKMGKVYMVAFVDVSSVERYTKEYIANALPLVMKHGGKVLSASDESVVKEGKFPPGRIAIAEFPSMEAAEAFYADPAYQPLIKVRQDIGATVLGFFPRGVAPE